MHHVAAQTVRPVRLACLLGLFLTLIVPQTQAQIYASQGGSSNGFYYYTIATSTWTTLAPIPSDSFQYGLSTDGTNVYAIGYSTGAENYKTYRYTPATNTWVSLDGIAVAPYFVSGPASGSAGPVFYVFNRTKVGCDPQDKFCHTASIYSYDVSANTYSKVADYYGLNTDGSAGVVAVGTSVYTLITPSTRLYQYDALTNTSTLKASAPGPFAYNGSATSDGTYVYAVADEGGYNRHIYRYSIATDTWSTLPAIAPGKIFGYMTTDGVSLYAAAGYGSTTVYRYDIAGGTWSTLPATPGTINAGVGSPVAFPSGGLLYVGTRCSPAPCVPVVVSRLR